MNTRPHMPALAAALAALAAFSATPPAHGPDDGSMLIDRTVAEVGGRRITFSEVMGEVRERLFEEGEAPSERAVQNYFASSLSNLVARQLVLLEYDNSGTKIPEWYFNQRLDRIVENGFGGDKARLVAALSQHGISYNDWKRRQRDDTILGTMRQQFVMQNLAARPADMERVYRESYATNTLPGRVKISMIALRESDDDGGKTLEKAREILSKLSTGGSFAALARTHSQESHSSEGGSWGYIEPADELRAELVEAIDSIKVGQVAGPVEAGGYVYLIRKDDEREDLSIPFSLVRDEIEKRLLDEAAAKRFDAWVRLLATKYTVRMFGEQ